MSTCSLTPAGFWRRFAAFTIDYMVLSFLTMPLLLIFIFQATTRPYPRISADEGMVTEDFLDDWSKKAINYYQTAVKDGILNCGMISILFGWCYYAGMESSPVGATIGKLAVGLRVLDEAGNKLSFGKAAVRQFGKILSALILGIGFLLAAFTKKKQALHDSMAGAIIVLRDLPQP